MALSTIGTNATNTLSALVASGAPVVADAATLMNAIKNDLVNGNPVWPGAYSQTGLLFVPNRGVLKVLPGDYIAYDSQGWPILISANSAANGPWTHSP